MYNSLPTDRLLLDFSLWSADLTRLAEEIQRTAPYADLYHLDVADAHFVPGLLFFPDLVAALRPLTVRPFHVHLMADQPARLIDDFVAAGADILTVHLELGPSVADRLHQIRDAGCRAGLAVALETPIEDVRHYLQGLDVIVMMGTALGIKGVGLSPDAAPRLRAMRALLKAAEATHVRLLADGGIRPQTVPVLRAAGADGIVPGSLVFKSEALAETVAWLRRLEGPPE
ncbi:MAG: ribulose-phosphate 3-epimerase [Anaerolineae bacterium]|nr:ribulose-phosphate 3-epimerase [Anaerolineae bacterium]